MAILFVFGLLLSCALYRQTENLLACCYHVPSVMYLLTSVTCRREFVHHLCPEKELTSAGSFYIPAVRLKCMQVELKGRSQSAVSAYSLRAQCFHLEIQSATSVS